MRAFHPFSSRIDNIRLGASRLEAQLPDRPSPPIRADRKIDSERFAYLIAMDLLNQYSEREIERERI
jgi:hypothetical protein